MVGTAAALVVPSYVLVFVADVTVIVRLLIVPLALVARVTV